MALKVFLSQISNYWTHAFSILISILDTDFYCAIKLFFISQAFYKLTMNMTKMSILMLYLRIFIQRWFRIICYVLLCVIASYMVAAFFASIFQCTPVARAWNKTIPGSCIDITANWYANAGFSIATDIIILALPMYPIYNSKIVLGRKIALMCVFALGAL